MPSAPSNADLGTGGVAMFQAVQAVIEIAERPSGEDDMLYRRFVSLADMIEEMDGQIMRRAFNLALIRLLYTVVKAAMRSHSTEATQDPQKAMAELVAGQDPEVVRAAMTAVHAQSLPDYIRAVSYGAATCVWNADLGYAAALVLRHLLTSLSGSADALLRWSVLGPVINAVAAMHYLRVDQ